MRALVSASGVLDSPMPSTNIFSSRSRMASRVKSLSLVTRLNDELHKKYRQLDFRQFGYSRISSFLRSMKSVTVHENQVTLREEAR